MAVQTHNFLKNENTDYNNVIDSIRTAPVLAKTAAYSVTADDARSGTIFTNRGASGAVAFTLPAPSADLAGCKVIGVCIVAQTISFETATVDTLIVVGDAAADKLTSPGTIGAHIECYCDGTSWIALGSGNTPGGTNALDYTAAT